MNSGSSTGVLGIRLADAAPESLLRANTAQGNFFHAEMSNVGTRLLPAPLIGSG
ncbi:hypothetical protein [Hoeflea sp.]|uniref:hypothetical protein n=1 Tax=Hoeflea sp. TaxID=1940281 RepID=UPI003B51FA2E